MNVGQDGRQDRNHEESTMPTRRNLTASAAGGIVYGATLYRFLSYAERNQLSSDSLLVFAALVLTVAFLVGLGARARYRTAGFVILGVWAAHALVVAVDVRADPTDHNLLPFEFVILGVCALPAYLGAGIAHVVDYIREPKG
jgi:hypothetical protein